MAKKELEDLINSRIREKISDDNITDREEIDKVIDDIITEELDKWVDDEFDK